MATNTIETPDIKFAGLYYADILEAAIARKRVDVPELTDENPNEPSIQILRSYAYQAHVQSALLDVVANEALMSTAALKESVREHLRLISYEMSPATPAKVTMVGQLTAPLSASSLLVPIGSQVSTTADPDTQVTIRFEADEDTSSVSSQTYTHVFACESGVFTDVTADANDPNTPATDFTPWASPSDNDAIYFGHTGVMWDTIAVFVTTEISGVVQGLWEYYTGDNLKAAPDSVAVDGSGLRFVLTGYLGPDNRAGTEINVQLNSTGVRETVVSTWTGTENVINTQTLLGQSEISLDPTAYTVGSLWEPLTATAASGKVNVFGQNDTITWPLPQSVSENWIKGEVNGVTAFWTRFRWILGQAAVPPVLQFVTINDGIQYVSWSATQGETQNDAPLASSNGEPEQRFTATRPFFIDDGADQFFVDGVQWTRVENFLSSKPSDLHYTIELTGEDDTAVAVTGNGTRGSIPPLGVQNIEWLYRHNANDDGNAGANTITQDRSSLLKVSNVFNPRNAAGWSASEGTTDESLARAKELGPATLRTLQGATSAGDLVTLTLRFVDDDGVKPFSRAFAVEEGFGPKTVELVVVVKGGGFATVAQLDELNLFFNGDKFAIPPIAGRFVANQQVVSTNFTPKIIDVSCDVYATGVTQEQVSNKLRSILKPEAQREDGSFEWSFGQEVSMSRLVAEVHEISEKITKVELSLPAQNVTLVQRELPLAGSIVVNILPPGGA